MSSGANPILDYEAAPIPPTGLPTSNQLDSTKKQERPTSHHDQHHADTITTSNEKSASMDDEKAEVVEITQVTSVSDEYDELGDEDYEGKPTAEDLKTLRRIPASMNWSTIAMVSTSCVCVYMYRVEVASDPYHCHYSA